MNCGCWHFSKSRGPTEILYALQKYSLEYFCRDQRHWSTSYYTSFRCQTWTKNQSPNMGNDVRGRENGLYLPSNTIMGWLIFFGVTVWIIWGLKISFGCFCKFLLLASDWPATEKLFPWWNIDWFVCLKYLWYHILSTLPSFLEPNLKKWFKMLLCYPWKTVFHLKLIYSKVLKLTFYQSWKKKFPRQCFEIELNFYVSLAFSYFH